MQILACSLLPLSVFPSSSHRGGRDYGKLSFGTARRHCSGNSLPISYQVWRVPRASLTMDRKWSTRNNFTIPPIDMDDRIEELVGEVKEMFHSLSDGDTSASAYDTAWVARVPSINDPNKPQFPTTLDWIINNQQKDGSWGEPNHFVLCDRLVCTLACVLALKTWAKSGECIARGIRFLQTHIVHLEKEDTSPRTCGFEVVFPSLLTEAKNLRMDLPYCVPYLREIFSLREKKINKIPLKEMHSFYTTLLYSLEALHDVVDWERILKLQSVDGSFLGSPSATSIVYIKTGDTKCLDFLTYIVRRFGDHAPSQYPMDLFERIWIVDSLQRLGIGHHFFKEILETLDYVYRHFDKDGICWGKTIPIPDIDDTSMAFRMLRLHGYPISSDVFNYYKDDEGMFVCMRGETHRGVSDMFNLYRASQVSFPGEEILKEARNFTKNYLQSCVKNNQFNDKWALKKALKEEVAHALKNPWKMSLERLEVREYINHYGVDDAWVGKSIYCMYNINNSKYLELAKLDYNRLQVTYKGEMDLILEWSQHCEFHDFAFTVPLLHEIHFSIASTMYEPEFSAARISYTKLNYIENIIKDLFERHKSITNLRLFWQACEQWNPSLINSLPLQVKVVFMGMYNSLNDLANEASNAQGKDMFPYLHDLRVRQIEEYMKNIEPTEDTTLEEFKVRCRRDFCGAIRVVPSMFLMGGHMAEQVLQYFDHKSHIISKLSFFLGLLVIVHTFKGRKTIDPIHHCMEEDNFMVKEALHKLEQMTDNAFDVLSHESLKPSHVPRQYRRLILEHAKSAQFFLSDAIDPTINGTERTRNAIELLFTSV